MGDLTASTGFMKSPSVNNLPLSKTSKRVQPLHSACKIGRAEGE
jgi:hypothetical protein